MNPPESFVPLTAAPGPGAPREFRVAVLNGQNPPASAGAPKADGFQSLAAQHPSAFSHPHGGEKRIGEPRVTVQRDGDRITHLRIQCSCGQVLDLACVYEAPAAATGAPGTAPA